MKLPSLARGFLYVLPLALVACGGGEPEVEAAPAPEPMSEAGAGAMREAFVRAWLSKDAASAVVFYADDAVMYSPDGTVATGKPAIQEGIAQAIAAGQDSIGMTKTSFEAAGDEATERGTITIRTLDLDAEDGANRDSGEYMTVMRRQADGTFKVVKDSIWMVATPE